MNALPGVEEVIVSLHEDSHGDQRLVAYVVLKPQQILSKTEIREFLKTQLPNYMIPAAFVLLDKLPLTPNGKVDRQALPEPDQTRPELEDRYVAPGTPIEKMLTSIWSDLLGIEQVGVHDDFFELGGHSLLAMRMLLLVEEGMGKVKPMEFFQKPTISYLAWLLGGDETQPASVDSASMIRLEKQVVSLARSNTTKPRSRSKNPWRTRLSWRTWSLGRLRRTLEKRRLLR